MLNKNVCPNCGQLYDTSLSKCPLCGTAPQVVETADPVQRRRITEAERKQRRADRKEAEQEARRRKRDSRYLEDEEEERLIEEEDALRREEKRRQKEEKRAARIAERNSGATSIPNSVVPSFTPGPARDGRGPMPAVYAERDRRRVPRVFLALSAFVLAAALIVGGSYLLWKLEVVKLPIYDKLAAKKSETVAPTETPTTEAPQTQTTTPSTLYRGEGAIPCTGITLSQTEIVFSEVDEQTQLTVSPLPENTTDEVFFSSSDAAVVKVSPVGIVTAVGPGEASITVTCGEEQAVCTVSCGFATPTAPTLPPDITNLVLVKDDMSFFAPGENFVLSVTNIPAGTPVEWESLDESVCTVDESGRVVAVGKGTTRVVARVGNLRAECWVRCPFTEG
ncbi:MAG: Ig-like domain-containing protein [Oscillospiraceae bacterium]|nr:Ig-like domain-containing protein [Oscillospiraceae bacterium]